MDKIFKEATEPAPVPTAPAAPVSTAPASAAAAPAAPAPAAYTEEEKKLIQDFYVAANLNEKKTQDTVRKLMGYFENDKSKSGVNIRSLKGPDYKKYFKDYIGDYKNIMTAKSITNVDDIGKKLQAGQKLTLPDKEKYAKFLNDTKAAGDRKLTATDITDDLIRSLTSLATNKKTK